jgi:hypothetical protein
LAPSCVRFIATVGNIARRNEEESLKDNSDEAKLKTLECERQAIGRSVAGNTGGLWSLHSDNSPAKKAGNYVSEEVLPPSSG